MTRRSKTYRNKIDALLGITVEDVEKARETSPLTRQRFRQRKRWAAHKARKQP